MTGGTQRNERLHRPKPRRGCPFCGYQVNPLQSETDNDLRHWVFRCVNCGAVVTFEGERERLAVMRGDHLPEVRAWDRRSGDEPL